jgi:hypothetical protein
MYVYYPRKENELDFMETTLKYSMLILAERKI